RMSDEIWVRSVSSMMLIRPSRHSTIAPKPVSETMMSQRSSGRKSRDSARVPSSIGDCRLSKVFSTIYSLHDPVELKSGQRPRFRKLSARSVASGPLHRRTITIDCRVAEIWVVYSLRIPDARLAPNIGGMLGLTQGLVGKAEPTVDANGLAPMCKTSAAKRADDY